MAKTYIGYLYQIKEGEKPQRDQWKIYKEVEAANIHGGYVLFRKVPWYKRAPFLPFVGPHYAEEVITGKRIPILADGMKGKIGGEHTFLKFDGTFKQRAKVATKEHLENYQKYHPKKDEFRRELEAIFKEGKRRANILKPGFMKKREKTEEDSISDLTKNDITLDKYGKKKVRKKLEKDLLTGEYEKNVDSIPAPSPEFESQVSIDRGINATGSTVGAVIPTVGGQFIHPGYNVGGPGMMPGAAGPMGGDFVDEAFAPGFASSKASASTDADMSYRGDRKEEQVKETKDKKTVPSSSSAPSVEKAPKKVEKPVSVASASVEALEAEVANEFDELGVPTKKKELNNTPVVNEEKVVETPVSADKGIDSDFAVRVSSAAKTEEQVVKEMAKVAESGSVAISTLKGVDLSTKFLKTERDLTEYYLYKKYGKEPTSQSVLSVIELEKSMDLLGDNSKSNTRSM